MGDGREITEEFGSLGDLSASISEWLQLHGWRATDMAAMLNAARRARHDPFAREEAELRRSSSASGPAASLDCDLDEAFAAIVVPALESLLGFERDRTRLKGVPLRPCEGVDDRSSRVLHHGDEGGPVILIAWTGALEDLIVLAHEAGHALQVLLSSQDGMPPVAREVCAFVAELALLEWCGEERPELFAALHAAWRARAGWDLRDRAFALLRALEDPDSRYRYAMNYPPARHLSLRLYRTSGPDRLRRYFSSGPAAVSMLDPSNVTVAEPRVSSDLPPFGSEDAEEAGPTRTFRRLGAITLVDVETWRAASRSTIETYARARRSQIEADRIDLLLDPDGRPAGYLRSDGRRVLPFATGSTAASPEGSDG